MVTTAKPGEAKEAVPKAEPGEQKANPIAPQQQVQPTVVPVAPPKPSPAAFIIQSPSRADRQIKAMFYGPYGVGKTTLAASAMDDPSMRDVLFIDAESGDMSLTNRPDISRIRVTDYRQLSKVVEYLRIHCRLKAEGNIEALRKLESQVNGGAPIDKPKQYNTVVIDSLSEIYRFAMYQITGVNTATQDISLEPEQTTWADYGKTGDMIRLLVRSFRDLPMNVVFICSERVQEDPDTKKKERRPNLAGQLSGEVQGFLDVVGYLLAFRTKGTEESPEGALKRRLFLEPGSTYQAKHRFADRQIPFIEEPTMGKLLKIARGQEV